jgi:hypothetical protein
VGIGLSHPLKMLRAGLFRMERCCALFIIIKPRTNRPIEDETALYQSKSEHRPCHVHWQERPLSLVISILKSGNQCRYLFYHSRNLHRQFARRGNVFGI